MKTQLALLFALSTGANAFAPVSSMKASTALNSQQDDSWITSPWSGMKQDDFYRTEEDYANESWQYRPWSNVKQEDHTPLTHKFADPTAPQIEEAAPPAAAQPAGDAQSNTMPQVSEMERDMVARSKITI